MNKLFYLKLSKLISNFKNGDSNAFTDIYSLTYKKVYYLALSIVKDTHVAEDLVQEVYIIVFNSLNDLKDNKLFIAWINRITYNLCIRYISKSKKVDIVELDEIDYLSKYNVHSNSPLDRFIEIEEYNYLINLLNKLPEIHSTVLIMRYLNSMKISDIAYSLDISEGTVKSRISNAKKGLRDLYSKDNRYKNMFIFMYSPIFISSANNLDVAYINHSINLNKILYNNTHNTHALFNPYLSNNFNNPMLYLLEKFIAVILASTVISLPVMESDLIKDGFIEAKTTFEEFIDNKSNNSDDDLSLNSSSNSDIVTDDMKNKDIESPSITSYSFVRDEFVIEISDNMSGVDYDSLKFKDVNNEYISVDFEISNNKIHIKVDNTFLDIAYLDISDKVGNTTTYSVLDIK